MKNKGMPKIIEKSKMTRILKLCDRKLKIKKSHIVTLSEVYNALGLDQPRGILEMEKWNEGS